MYQTANRRFGVHQQRKKIKKRKSLVGKFKAPPIISNTHARIYELIAGKDSTLEGSDELLQEAIDQHDLRCSYSMDELRAFSASNRKTANASEPTIYPSVTENECLPVVERISGLTFNTDVFAGYSPERINTEKAKKQGGDR